jgi:hypothetical protein
LGRLRSLERASRRTDREVAGRMAKMTGAEQPTGGER